MVSQVKLIAEPWDVGPGGYQVGNFPPQWTEWNGKYRDTVRDFWRGEPADARRVRVATHRIGGSLRALRAPAGGVVNFVTAHDGFTLRDLVSYNEKHNEANGEDDNDGESDNRSNNCGVEGPTDDQAVLTLRARQQRNFLATLLLSQGVPMIAHGDELGRTQDGNNNGYAQDNEVTWVDWEQSTSPLVEFTAAVARLRREHPTFRRSRFFDGRPRAREEGEPIPDIVWLRPDGTAMQPEDWDSGFGRAIGCSSTGSGIRERDRRGEAISDRHFLVLFNAGDETAGLRYSRPTSTAALGGLDRHGRASRGGRRSMPVAPCAGETEVAARLREHDEAEPDVDHSVAASLAALTEPIDSQPGPAPTARAAASSHRVAPLVDVPSADPVALRPGCRRRGHEATSSDLGVSWAYLSPLLPAARGRITGTTSSIRRGGSCAWRTRGPHSIRRGARARGLGILVDIVPNHRVWRRRRRTRGGGMCCGAADSRGMRTHSTSTGSSVRARCGFRSWGRLWMR